MAAFVFPEVVEPQSDDDLGQPEEGSLTWSDATPTVRTSTKKTAARALQPLLINAVDERVLLLPWSQATKALRGTSLKNTNLRLQAGASTSPDS